MPAGEYTQARWSQSVPEDWREAIDEHREKLGLTLAEYTRQALRDKLPKRVAARLSEPQRAGRPKKQTGG